LVAAFDHVKQNSSETDVNRFKEQGLFGIEQEAEVVALAIVNMIFRGDGKNNIIEGSCFQKHLIAANDTVVYSPKRPEEHQLTVTRVLMNPPFALKQSDEKEYKFVERALDEMVDGGILFSVLPYSAMVRPGGYRDWREKILLKKHTLLSVITFPEDLFYPIGVHTLGIFVKKGIPHPADQNVLWIRGLNDGLLKSKGKRLPNARAKDDYPRIEPVLRAFIASPALDVPNIDRFQKACTIDFSDPLLELVPENYLDQAPPTEQEVRDGIEQVIRNAVAFLIRDKKEDE
jgi:type I restriction-modification system DNA methylase subunit